MDKSPKKTRRERQKEQKAREAAKRQQQPSPELPPVPAPANPTQAPAPHDASSATEKPGAQNQDIREDIGPANRWEFWQFVFAGCEVLFSLCLVISAIVQIIVGHWQFVATRDQYNAMIEQNEIVRGQLAQAELDQRPWLKVEIFIGEPEAGKAFPVKIKFSNSGKTPAILTGEHVEPHGFAIGATADGIGHYEIVDGRKVLTLSEEFLGRLESDLDRSDSGVIPPGSDAAWTTWNKFDELVSADDVKEISDGRMTVFVIGVFEYSDVSEKRFKTRACWIYLASEKHSEQYVKYSYMK